MALFRKHNDDEWAVVQRLDAVQPLTTASAVQPIAPPNHGQRVNALAQSLDDLETEADRMGEQMVKLEARIKTLRVRSEVGYALVAAGMALSIFLVGIPIMIFGLVLVITSFFQLRKLRTARDLQEDRLLSLYRELHERKVTLNRLNIPGASIAVN